MTDAWSEVTRSELNRNLSEIKIELLYNKDPSELKLFPEIHTSPLISIDLSNPVKRELSLSLFTRNESCLR